MSYTTDKILADSDNFGTHWTECCPPIHWGDWTDEDFDAMAEADCRVLDRLDAKDEAEVD